MEPLRKLALAAVALLGLVIVVLSFMTWLEFESDNPRPTSDEDQVVSVELSGDETSVWRDLDTIGTEIDDEESGWCSCRADFGDGYLTAALGVLLVALASAAAFTRVSGTAALAAVITSLAVVVIAGFNAFADWNATWLVGSTPVIGKGDVQLALYGVVVAGAIAAILSVAAWAAEGELERDEEFDSEEDGEDDSSLEASHG